MAVFTVKGEFLMEDRETNDQEAASNEVVVDANIYGLLLEVISKNEDDIEKQQKSLKDIAGAMYKPSVSRRVFRVLFPSVEATRRVR
jgi:hypothetical protein